MMKKVSLFSTALAVVAGLSIGAVNADAATQKNSSNINEVGSMVYANLYGQDYVNNAHNISIFKDSNGRYGIGQGTTESTAFFKINNDGTVTMWQLKNEPNTPVYKLGYTKKTVSLSSLQKAENQTSGQKATISHASSAINNNQPATPGQNGASTVTANASNTKTQQPTFDSQVIDDLGWVLCQKYFGKNFNKYDFTIFKDSNGRYGTGQGTADSTIYFKINSDGKTMTVWEPVKGSGTTTANQKYTTSTIPLSDLGYPDPTVNSSNQASTQMSSQSSASANQNNNQSATQASAAGKVASKTNTNNGEQTFQQHKQVLKQANRKISVPSTQGKQTISYYQVGALVYAKTFGIDRLGADQGLQLTMNKHHSRFILGEGTTDSTLYFRVNRGKKTVTVWASTGDDGSTVKKTYQISDLLNEFSSQQKLVDETAQALR